VKCNCGHKAKDHSEESGSDVTQGCQETENGSWCLCELSCGDVWSAAPAPQDDAGELRVALEHILATTADPGTATDAARALEKAALR
jgi:hypothetical protein